MGHLRDLYIFLNAGKGTIQNFQVSSKSEIREKLKLSYRETDRQNSDAYYMGAGSLPTYLFFFNIFIFILI